MIQFWALSRRAILEAWRTPEQLFPTVFIPLFFLVVNVGQAAKIFPAGLTPFLEGQNYAAFQVPSALLLAASFGGAAMYLVEDIEGGYFDKLRASPVSRTAIVLGRLTAEGVKAMAIAALIMLVRSSSASPWPAVLSASSSWSCSCRPGRWSSPGSCS